ncbi:lipoprotein intramolecular transacylase Lit, partial [Lactobacillus nasalidis]
MKKFLTQLLELLYQFLFAVSSAVVGAIVFSWPLLLLFTLLEKTYQTVNLTVGQVMSNYNQLLLYLLWPGKHQLKMSDLPTSASAASHFAEVKSLFVLAEIFFLLALAVSFYFSQRKKPLRLSQTQALVLMLLPVAVMPFALSD